jgi:HEAT repeat protein
MGRIASVVGLAVVGLTVATIAVIYWVSSAAVAAEVAELAPKLEDRDRDARVDAACRISALLDRWGSGSVANHRERVLDVLLDGLEAVDIGTCTRAAESLTRWREQAVDVLREALASTDDQVRIHATYAASLYPMPELLPPLRDALRDGRVEVRVYALEAIGRMKLNQIDDELVADVVFRVWKDTDPWACNAAAEALFHLGHWTGIPALVRTLEGRFWPRFNAYERLTRIYRSLGRTLPPFYADGYAARRIEEARDVKEAVYGDPELLRRLIGDLAAWKNQLFTATKWSLTEMGPYAVPALSRALTREKKFVHVHAAEVLALLGEPQTPAKIRQASRDALVRVARPALRTLLGKPGVDVDEGLYAMRAIACIGNDADVPILLGHVHGTNPDLAVKALEVIGRIGTPAAVKALRELKVSGELEEVRRQALRRAEGGS